MSFYIRKSLRFGPVRFNLSKSGVGVSVGIKGFRVGSGPRGNYVHMGRGGLYYRASLSSPSRSSRGPAPIPVPHRDARPALPSADDVVMRDIDSEATAQIVDSSSHALVQELWEKHGKLRFARAGLVGGGLITLLGLAAPRPGFGLALFVLSVALYVILRVYDARRKTTVIFYDLADESADLFRRLHDAFSWLGAAKKLWHIPSEGKVRDVKYHAGADTLVKRDLISVHFKNPPFVKTNIPTPSLRVGTQTLYFFPDRILIFDAKDIGGLSYDSLRIDISTTHFIEQEGVPRDARTVGQTWRYVNKKGGPDRRFSNNPTIPVAEYETVRLTSRFGLNEALQVSRVGSFTRMVEVVRRIDNYIRAQPTVANATPPEILGSAASAQNMAETAKDKPGPDLLPIIAAGIAGVCIILLLFAHASPKASTPAASVTTAASPVKARTADTVPVIASTLPAEKTPVTLPTASEPSISPPPPQPPSRSEPVPVVRFSETTPLPATLILNGTLVLMSREHGVVGLGKGQQITVTARSDQQLTVMSDGKAFAVEARKLADAIIIPRANAPAPQVGDTGLE
jgi:hypothetical protein